MAARIRQQLHIGGLIRQVSVVESEQIAIRTTDISGGSQTWLQLQGGQVGSEVARPNARDARHKAHKRCRVQTKQNASSGVPLTTRQPRTALPCFCLLFSVLLRAAPPLGGSNSAICYWNQSINNNDRPDRPDTTHLPPLISSCGRAVCDGQCTAPIDGYYIALHPSGQLQSQDVVLRADRHVERHCDRAAL